MNKFSTELIRLKWIDFFKSKNHFELPFSSLIPIDDPSLLWINSGVATLKPFFEGKKNPPSYRLVNCQKSIRTNDIENVGYSTRHHTLFEMLGNFSIGDYFKKDAILYAWEFLTSKNWIGIDKNRLYITVYEKDHLAYDIWKNIVKVDETHIIKCSKKQNFWEIGEGPCGPNTEIFYDRGNKYDSNNIGLKLLKEDIENDRYLEIWNIVFSEFNSVGNGKYKPLPRKNIDTGAGLERLATILQDVPTSFDIDIFQKIIFEIEKLTNNKYKYDSNNFFLKDAKQEKINICFKIIADHIRAITFTIADGVYPSNKSQGYVIRRLIRRSIIYGRKLEINESFMYKLVSVVINAMGKYYSYLKAEESKIKEIVFEEEKKFIKTLTQGYEQLKFFIDKNNTVTNKQAFMLFESFGYPFELVQEICKEHNIILDGKDFDKFLIEHKKNAKKNAKKVQAITKQNDFLIKLNANSKFTGYENEIEPDCKVNYLFKNDKLVDKLENEDGFIILDKTPFYAEKGGQAADNGFIKKDNTLCNVLDVQSGINNENVHYVEVSGKIATNDIVEANINHNKRLYTMKNHSGTHILHSAIRHILGQSAMQVGSYNDDNYLRIDISYNKNISFEEIKKINSLCLKQIDNAIKSEVIYCKYEDAINKHKALAFFKDKYDFTKEVRIVKFSEFSVELCGGTHVKNSKDIQELLITKVSSIGNNTYRFVALTSKITIGNFISDKLQEFLSIKEEVSILNDKLNKPKKIIYDDNEYEYSFLELNKINENINQLNKLKNEIMKEIENNRINAEFKKFIDLKPNIILENLNFIFNSFNNLNKKTIKNLLDFYRNKYKNIIIIFNNITSEESKGTIYITISEDLKPKYNSGNIAKLISNKINGRGGGNPIYAQLGYNYDIEVVNEYLKNIGEII